jgi:hypothetical protein
MRCDIRQLCCYAFCLFSFAQQFRTAIDLNCKGEQAMFTKQGEQALSRRQFLKLGALAAGTGVLAACVAPSGAPASTGAESAPAGDGAVNVVVWYQDWDGANRIMNAAQEARTESNPNVTIELTPIGYSDLFAKLLPPSPRAPKAMC